MRHLPGDLLLSRNLHEGQRLSASHVPGLAERGGPNLWGLELCLEIQRIGDRVLVLTSGGHVGWTYPDMFEGIRTP